MQKECINNYRKPDPDSYEALAEELLEGPWWVVDILPEQVPAKAGGQYFAVERYYLQTARLRRLRRKYAEILLRLNCYRDMAVSFDGGESWELNPDPEGFAAHMEGFVGRESLRAIFPAERAIITMESEETHFTVYDPGAKLLSQLQRLAVAEGCFLWQPEIQMSSENADS